MARGRSATLQQLLSSFEKDRKRGEKSRVEIGCFSCAKYALPPGGVPGTRSGELLWDLHPPAWAAIGVMTGRSREMQEEVGSAQSSQGTQINIQESCHARMRR